MYFRQKNYGDLLEDDRIRMACDNFGNAKLVIRDVNPDDAGVYFCTAENKDGKAKCAATLRVTGEYTVFYVVTPFT